MIAKKAVELATGLLLATQLIMGTLFGILGRFLADRPFSVIKVALERRLETNGEEQGVAGGNAE